MSIWGWKHQWVLGVCVWGACGLAYFLLEHLVFQWNASNVHFPARRPEILVHLASIENNCDLEALGIICIYYVFTLHIYNMLPKLPLHQLQCIHQLPRGQTLEDQLQRCSVASMESDAPVVPPTWSVSRHCCIRWLGSRWSLGGTPGRMAGMATVHATGHWVGSITNAIGVSVDFLRL